MVEAKEVAGEVECVCSGGKNECTGLLTCARQQSCHNAGGQKEHAFQESVSSPIRLLIRESRLLQVHVYDTCTRAALYDPWHTWYCNFESQSWRDTMLSLCANRNRFQQ
ncbi:unnamed protein product [Chondrus crispus]|uniref:Uncharacterized protein n=1 Tax=Chondrus crispus TaxID=2769 RepID=R7QK71_CHOCR|nr:unnamed protein product [Chondrus crispus]CDF38464.1 unnamed protein product [Chondrus crispus]|eukprot:XP_005718357.1 unnamed protein product [Chondrus crispus]